MKLPHIDNEREFDWGKTSPDYSKYRPGYPESFWETLAALGVGRPGQKILDLGTGTGVLARAFAKRGAEVTGIDISENQIAEAKALAAQEGLDIAFHVSRAEDFEATDGHFDIVSAGQSWLYFDASAMIPKVLRWMKQDGCFALTHLLWMPRKDTIARKSEELVLKYNPDWKGADYNGAMPAAHAWAKDHFDLKTFHVMTEPIEFTHETWRGRFRACRGVGASLPESEIRRFDEELARLLTEIAPPRFSILHQMTIHICARRGAVTA